MSRLCCGERSCSRTSSSRSSTRLSAGRGSPAAGVAGTSPIAGLIGPARAKTRARSLAPRGEYGLELLLVPALQDLAPDVDHRHARVPACLLQALVARPGFVLDVAVRVLDAALVHVLPGRPAIGAGLRGVDLDLGSALRAARRGERALGVQRRRGTLGLTRRGLPRPPRGRRGRATPREPPRGCARTAPGSGRRRTGSRGCRRSRPTSRAGPALAARSAPARPSRATPRLPLRPAAARGPRTPAPGLRRPAGKPSTASGSSRRTALPGLLAEAHVDLRARVALAHLRLELPAQRLEARLVELRRHAPQRAEAEQHPTAGERQLHPVPAPLRRPVA